MPWWQVIAVSVPILLIVLGVGALCFVLAVAGSEDDK